MKKIDMMNTEPSPPWLVAEMSRGATPQTLRKHDPCFTTYKWGDGKAESSVYLRAVCKAGLINFFEVKIYNCQYRGAGDITWEFDHSVSWLFPSNDFELALQEFQEASVIVDCINSMQPWKDSLEEPKPKTKETAA